MAEEVRNVAYVTPRAMMWTWLGNGLVWQILAITCCYCVGNTSTVLAAPLGARFIQIFLNTTGSVGVRYRLDAVNAYHCKFRICCGQGHEFAQTFSRLLATMRCLSPWFTAE